MPDDIELCPTCEYAIGPSNPTVACQYCNQDLCDMCVSDHESECDSNPDNMEVEDE